MKQSWKPEDVLTRMRERKETKNSVRHEDISTAMLYMGRQARKKKDGREMYYHKRIK